MMTRTSYGLFLSLALAACATTEEPDFTEQQAQRGGVAFDSSAIAATPAAAVPAARLHASAFADAEIAGKLVGTVESFDAPEVIGTRSIRRSPSWLVQKDETRGRVLAVRNVPSAGPPTRLADAQLAANVRARLVDWGVGAGEIGDVAMRRAMVEDLDGAVPSAPRLHGLKGFVRRTINGVRVQGHRAVVTFTPDGEVQRVLMHWPPLAAQGHKLRTALPRGQIVLRAQAALKAKGITRGNARLDWAYVPELKDNGEVALTLKAMVELPSRQLSDGSDEESRVLAIDVDATP